MDQYLDVYPALSAIEHYYSECIAKLKPTKKSYIKHFKFLSIHFIDALI